MQQREDNLVRIDWQPRLASLRSFGAALAMLCVSSLIVRYRQLGPHALRDALALATYAGGLSALALALLRPGLLRLPYVTLGAITYPARWLVAFLSLALLYYGLVTPIAVMFRVMRKYRAQSGEPDGSAWSTARPRPDKAHYFRQF